jgi:hypothetical protein
MHERKLEDLVSVGPAIRRDFALLGINTVAEPARQEPAELYERLSRTTGNRQDPCVLDTFHAAVAQARDPHLAHEKCQWWYWSRRRKAAAVSAR